MTRAIRLPGRLPRAVVVAALAGLAAWAAAAPRAEAAFSLGKCEPGGTAVTGAGASFQNTAHNSVWKSIFQNSFCTPDPGHFPNVTYTGGGSGTGRRKVGERTGDNADGSKSRNQPERFGATDEPLTATAKNQIQIGTDAAGDEAQIHQIPVATGATVAAANFPDWCDVKSLPAANQTDTAATDFTNRVRFTEAQWEQIWNGATTGGEKATQWKDIFPAIKAIDTDAGTAGAQNPGGKTDLQCQDQSLIRVVRFDDSGTTYSLKDQLSKIPGAGVARGWLSTFITPDTRTWPNASIGEGLCGAGKSGPEGAIGPDGVNRTLVTNCANGNSELLNKLNATDGSVGYSDLGTAVSKSLLVAPGTPGDVNTADDGSRPGQPGVITQLPNANGNFVEATEETNGFKTTNPNGTGGSNCDQTLYSNVPSSTLGDWSKVTGTRTGPSWPVCTLTWELAFQDNACAYGSGAGEEEKARAVKDYLKSIVTLGQGSELKNNGHYWPLPPDIRAKAEAGVDQIGWLTGTCVAASGGGPSGGPTKPKPTGGGTPTGGGGGGTLPVVQTGRFSIPRTVISSNGTALVSIRTSGPGTILLEGVGNIARVRSIGRVRRTVSKAGTYKVRFKPSRRALRTLRRKHRLRIRLKVTFTPRGGKPKTSTRTVTLKLKPKKKKKRKS